MPIYNCPNCDKQFDRRSNYNYHVYKRSRPCTAKNNTTIINDQSEDLENNKQQPHLECPQCHKVYHNKSNLNRHLRQYCTHKSNCDNSINNSKMSNKDNFYDYHVQKATQIYK